jgi:uncharacterized protein YbjT (DUF2867 family)
MQIVITGSLGNIGRPLTQDLLQRGHVVIVISSNPDKRQEIEQLGARAAIGKLEDVDFLKETLRGADALFAMEPPNFGVADHVVYYSTIANSYVAAAKATGLQRIVHLSSWGAHLESGTGFITGSYHAEQIINGLQGETLLGEASQGETLQGETLQGETLQGETLLGEASQRETLQRETLQRETSQGENLQRDTLQREILQGNSFQRLSVTHLRAGSFYTNLYNFAGMIKHAGFIGTNYGGEDRVVMVHPRDIATVAAEELTKMESELIRYVASTDITASAAAKAIGVAIGKPDLQWVTLSDEEVKKALLESGMPLTVVEPMVELGAAIHSGAMRSDYDLHPPVVMGKTSIEAFAKEFSAAY